MTEGETSSAVRYNHVLKVIDSHLVPDSIAKAKRGEVFTPPDLVREMLFGLNKSVLDEKKATIWGVDSDGAFQTKPDEKNRIGGIPTTVWSDPKKKWLDPASGIGNFPIIAFYRLDHELKKNPGFSDADKRRKYIIEEMLFMIEIDKGNVETCKKIFKEIHPGATPNICCADTLSLTKAELKKQFGVDEFDVIMGNPPYNTGGVKSSGKLEDEDYKTIWPYFVLNKPPPEKKGGKFKSDFPGALNILKSDGYLVYIHPSSWLHKNDNAGMNEVLFDYQLDFLRIYTNAQAGRLFSGGGVVRCAYYCLKKKKLEKSGELNILDTNLNFETIKVSDLNEFDNVSTPNDENDSPASDAKTKGYTLYQNNNSLLLKIFKKTTSIGELTVSDGKSGDTPYLGSKGKIKGDTTTGPHSHIVTHKETGIVVCKSNTPFKYASSPKIILKGSSNLFHFDDFDGKYGIYGNWGFYIVDSKENLEKISKFLDTNLAKIIMSATKEDQDFIEPKYLPDIRHIKLKNISDKRLCKLFELDYDYVKSQKFITNNQTIASVTEGCKKQTRKAKVASDEGARGGARSFFDKTRKRRRF